MTLPTITIRQLLEAGVHFGHMTRRWNPKMKPYLYGNDQGIHIIDLQKTVHLMYRALVAVRERVAAGGRVLFVGTKRQASEAVAQAAQRCGQYYINHRWLGGTLTNWKTISASISQLKSLEEDHAKGYAGRTKKEILGLERERNKLQRALGGIKDMGGLPDILVVIDANKEKLAIQEANKIGIPVVAILDSNVDPDGITYPVPGNDDASRAIVLYCSVFAQSVLDGIQAEMVASGVDLGAMETLPESDAGEELEESVSV